MSLFKKKCAQCCKKIEKGKEVFRKVKDPIFADKKLLTFCCSNHADEYEATPVKSCSSCRGA